MARVIKFEGRTMRFPDDATDDEIRAALDGNAGPVQAPATQPSAENDFLDLPVPDAQAGTTAPEPEKSFMDNLLGALDYADNTGAIVFDRASEGAANVAGIPVDLVNALPMLANIIPGVDGVGPISNKPFGGSDYLNDARKGFGLLPDAPEPADAFQKITGRVGEEVGAAAVPFVGTAARAARTTLPAVREAGNTLERMFVEPFLVNPSKVAASEAAASTASGLGAGIANLFVDRDTTQGQIADLLGSLTGVGVGAAGSALGGRLKDLLAAASGDPRFASEVVRQNAADTLISNSDKLGATVNPTDPYAPVDTTNLLDAILQPSAAESAVPGFRPSTADRAGDFGLASLENARSKGPNAGRFRARQDANTEAVDNRMSELAPNEQPGALNTALADRRDTDLRDASGATASAQADFDRVIQDLIVQSDAEGRGATIRDGLANANRAAREAEHAAWSGIEGYVDPRPLAETVDSTIDGLSLARQQRLAETRETAEIPKRLSGTEDEPVSSVPMRELTDARSVLLQEQRNALSGPQPDRNKAEALGRLIDDFNAYLDSDAVPKDIRDRTTEARALSQNVNERFNRPNDPIADTLAAREGRPNVPDSAVGKRFVQPDDRQASNVDRLLAETDLTSHGASVREAVRDEILAGIEKKKALGDPDRLEQYLNQFSHAFSRFPTLREEVTQAVKAGRDLDAAGSAQTEVTKRLGTPDGSVQGSSVVARYLKFDPEQSARAMRNVMNSNKPGEAIDELLTYAGNDRSAMEGARRAFWDVMERDNRSHNAAFETSQGVEPWMPKKWRAFLEQPNVAAVSERLYRDDPEHLASIKQIAEALSTVNTGTKAGNAINPSGSAQALRNGPVTLAEAQAKFIDVQRGRLNPLYAVTYLAGKIAGRLVGKQAEKAYQMLLDEALMNPEVAAQLLKDNNPANRAALARSAKLYLGNQASTLIDLLNGGAEETDEQDEILDAVQR